MSEPVKLPTINGVKNPTLFLDRDGTINVDMTGSYVTKPSEFKLIPGAADALIRAKNSGFKLAIITNQQGIAKGLYSENDLHNIHNRMHELICAETNNLNFKFDNIQFCPHKSELKCECRKPKTDMLKNSSAILESDLSKSFYIGDKDADLLCAHTFGVPFILVRTGYGKDTEKDLATLSAKPIFIADDLSAAIDFILQQLNKNKL